MKAPQPSRALVLVQDLSAVVLIWLLALLLENVVLGFAWGTEFSGAWEVTQVRRLVVPMAVAGLAPASFTLVGWWRVAILASQRSRLARVALADLGVVAGGCLGLGISHGRHFDSAGVRAAFVLALAAAAGAACLWLVPRLTGWLRTRPLAIVFVGLGVGLAGWLGDAFVLPRLYPTFHVALLLASLVGFGVVGLGVRLLADLPPRIATAIAALVALLWVGASAWSPRALGRMERLGNLRTVVLEHAPLLGRAVELAVMVRPPPAETEAPKEAPASPGEVTRALDWTGHDVVLISVDALRADHVSAYGYARPTTPNLDALAAEGALFTSAYCPTPHTSYSVTSMMTGKYMRPLLALGLGEDSETWAQDLRLYGWRTAAFYPPAVFFIDQDRFQHFEQEHLGFEYFKNEFADPPLREEQVKGYLQGAPADKPLFMWVHFFEPHEPYVAHPEHVFTGGASADVDAYDGEVATADDGIGRVVRAVRAARPGAVVIVTADHGEEFGEHGGRYHGTTVYEEQVHVPLVVAGPGVRKGARVAPVVQTIDLLPTTLSALGLPRPARLRGRDLGPLLAGEVPLGGAVDSGFAFAETDDYTLVASGDDRLVCQRRAAACSLYRLPDDPQERHDLSAQEPDRLAELRGKLRAATRDHGKFEAAGGPALPEALRRGLVGDADAAVDVAALLDDADVGIRRKAAEVSFALHARETVPQLRRALRSDEDEEVRRWSALALVRAGDPSPPLVDTLLKDPSHDWRRRTALALAERASNRACPALDAWWNELAASVAQEPTNGEPPQLPLDLPHTRELLAATAKSACPGAVPGLIAALKDVRARPYVADALGAIGDEKAKGPLLALLANEKYVTTRPHEAEALLAIAIHAGQANPGVPPPVPQLRTLRKAPKGPANLIVLLSDPGATLDASADGKPLPPAAADGPVRIFPLPADHGPGVMLLLRPGSGSIRGIWLAATAALD
jgi:arylsulfatase A-like enzyme